MSRMKLVVGILGVSSFSSVGFSETLPRGVGSIMVGGRQYSSDSTSYDQSGVGSSLNSRFDSNYNADTMRSGKGGTDLKRLYDNIRKYDSSTGSSSKSIADDLTLGSQKGTVKSDVLAQVIGMGFGLTDKITVFAGVPFIKASLDADIEFEGKNNASEIKNKLGDAAFDELKKGLDEASRLNKATVMSKINDEYQYKSINHWEYQGIGDMVLGAKTDLTFDGGDAPKYTLGLNAQLNLPTGPKYDPDSLTQMPLSRGYYAFDVLTDHRLTWTYFAAGSEIGGGFGLPQNTIRRVPEGDETLISADRKSTVQWQPGMDTKASVYGMAGNSVIRSQYKLGVSEHQADSFSGSIDGNYAGMGQATASKEIYHEVSIILTTVKDYQQKRIAVPFVLALTAHDTISGINMVGKKYIELTFMTFFSTGAHSEKRQAGEGYASNVKSHGRKYSSN